MNEPRLRCHLILGHECCLQLCANKHFRFSFSFDSWNSRGGVVATGTVLSTSTNACHTPPQKLYHNNYHYDSTGNDRKLIQETSSFFSEGEGNVQSRIPDSYYFSFLMLSIFKKRSSVLKHNFVQLQSFFVFVEVSALIVVKLSKVSSTNTKWNAS